MCCCCWCYTMCCAPSPPTPVPRIRPTNSISKMWCRLFCWAVVYSLCRCYCPFPSSFSHPLPPPHFSFPDHKGVISVRPRCDCSTHHQQNRFPSSFTWTPLHYSLVVPFLYLSTFFSLSLPLVPAFFGHGHTRCSSNSNTGNSSLFLSSSLTFFFPSLSFSTLLYCCLLLPKCFVLFVVCCVSVSALLVLYAITVLPVTPHKHTLSLSSLSLYLFCVCLSVLSASIIPYTYSHKYNRNNVTLCFLSPPPSPTIPPPLLFIIVAFCSVLSSSSFFPYARIAPPFFVSNSERVTGEEEEDDALLRRLQQ